MVHSYDYGASFHTRFLLYILKNANYILVNPSSAIVLPLLTSSLSSIAKLDFGDTSIIHQACTVIMFFLQRIEKISRIRNILLQALSVDVYYQCLKPKASLSGMKVDFSKSVIFTFVLLILLFICHILLRSLLNISSNAHG